MKLALVLLGCGTFLATLATAQNAIPSSAAGAASGPTPTTPAVAVPAQPGRPTPDPRETSSQLDPSAPATNRLSTIPAFAPVVARQTPSPAPITLTLARNADSFAIEPVGLQITRYEYLNKKSFLDPGPDSNEPSGDSSGFYGWAVEKMRPEMVRSGRVQAAGGLVTAIKKKNPLCLVNPLVFAAGW